MSGSSETDFGFNLTSLKESRKVKETEFERSHPKSKQLFERALEVMPGGNTRYQVFFKPFPFTLPAVMGVDYLMSMNLNTLTLSITIRLLFMVMRILQLLVRCKSR